MTTAVTGRRAGTRPAPRPTVVRELARIEARRMLGNPLLAVGLVLSALFARDVSQETWSGAQYSGYAVVLTPLLLAVSVVCALAAGRDVPPAFEDVPVTGSQRIWGVLLGGLAQVALVAVVVAGAAAWLRATGGLNLGDEPGRTLHAHYSVPELLQPVALAVLAVTLGVALGRVVRQRFAAGIVLFVFWFLTGGAYWIFNGPSTMAMAVVQVQPSVVEVAPRTADPATFPADWLLSAPGQFQDYWGRVVVSPEMAAWHDVYLLGLAVVAAGVALRGTWRRRLLAAGAVLAVVAVLLQRVVQP